MVTAVDPDFDILEMPFDAYLTKPVRRDDLNEVVERLLTVSDYDSAMQEYFALVEKRVALESSKQQRNLDESDEYGDLVARISTLEADLDDMLDSATDAEEIFRQEF
jgi:DNA-binding response OmpR family regulator